MNLRLVIIARNIGGSNSTKVPWCQLEAAFYDIVKDVVESSLFGSTGKGSFQKQRPAADAAARERIEERKLHLCC